jgi:hypothetical protein
MCQAMTLTALRFLQRRSTLCTWQLYAVGAGHHTCPCKSCDQPPFGLPPAPSSCCCCCCCCCRWWRSCWIQMVVCWVAAWPPISPAAPPGCAASHWAPSPCPGTCWACPLTPPPPPSPCSRATARAACCLGRCPQRRQRLGRHSRAGTRPRALQRSYASRMPPGCV